MKKRLRKKKHLGEFREYGFAVHVHFNLEARDWADVFDDFVNFTDRYGWYTSGDIATEKGVLRQVVCETRFGSGVAEKQHTFCEEVLALPAVTRVEVWPVIDAWNASEKEHLQHRREPESYAFKLEKNQ
jgi:uncharacterized protein YggL (DUF469 family)